MRQSPYPSSPSPRLPFTWSGYHANHHWTVSSFSLSSPPSTPPSSPSSLSPSLQQNPIPTAHHPTPRCCYPQTPPLAPLLEKGPSSPLQREHRLAVGFRQSVIVETHVVTPQCEYGQCETSRRHVFLMCGGKKKRRRYYGNKVLETIFIFRLKFAGGDEIQD